MADNTTLKIPSGSSDGDVVRTLEVTGSIKYGVGVAGMLTAAGSPNTVTIPVAAALADNTANPTTLLHGSCLMVYDGSTWDLGRGDATNGLLVNLGSNNDVTLATLPDTASGDLAAMRASLAGTLTVGSHAVTNAGTFAVQAAQSGTWTVQPGNTANTTAWLVTGTGGTFPVTDSGGSLTVDAPVGTPVFVRLSDGSSAISTLPVSLASVPSHAVTNAGTFAVQADSVVPGTAATSLGKAVDSAAGGTDTGVAILAVRDDSLGALTPAEGDYVPLRVSSTGALHVTGGGGGTQYNVDDAAGGSDTGTLLLAIRDDSLTTLTPADGDYVGLRVSSTGALHVTGGGGGTEYTEDVATANPIVGTATMMERDDALSTLTPIEGDWAAMRCTSTGALWVGVDGTVAATQSGTWNVTNISGTVSLPTGAATAAKQPALGTAGTASSDVITVQGIASMTALTVAQATAGNLNCTEASAATIATNTGNAATSLAIVDDWDNAASDGASVSGDVAHDTADAGEPVKLGAKAVTSLSGLTLVAANDRTNLFAGVDGVLITRPHANLEDIVAGSASNTDGTSTQVIATAGAGIKQYLTSFTITNTSATDTYCELKSGTTVRWRCPVPANGGVTFSFPVPLPPNAADEAWNFDMGAGVTTAYCSMLGFKSKV